MLAWIAKGRLTKEVALGLGLSPTRIKLHRTRVLRKLNVPTISAALLLAQAGGAVPLPTSDGASSQGSPAPRQKSEEDVQADRCKGGERGEAGGLGAAFVLARRLWPWHGD